MYLLLSKKKKPVSNIITFKDPSQIFPLGGLHQQVLIIALSCSHNTTQYVSPLTILHLDPD